MIIRPRNQVPIQTERGTLFDLMVFPLYQTRADYAEDHGGQEPPPPDPSQRAKHWYDPRFTGMQEDDGETVSYLVLGRNPRTGEVLLDGMGRPRLVDLVLPTYIAGRVNIPSGLANEFPQNTTIMKLQPYPFPIRELHADEDLRRPETPFGDVVVFNIRLAAQSKENRPGFDAEDRMLLKSIQGKLDLILKVLGSGAQG